MSTPVLDVPGAYPTDPHPETNGTGNGNSNNLNAPDQPHSGAKDVLHHSAESYIAPERLDQAEHIIEDVGHIAAQYVPTGVASVVSSYWCEWPLKSSGSRAGSPRSEDVGIGSDRASSSSRASERLDERRESEASTFWTGVGYFLVGVGWLLWGGEHSFTLSLSLHSYPLAFILYIAVDLIN
jgi:hypothetical protein